MSAPATQGPEQYGAGLRRGLPGEISRNELAMFRASLAEADSWMRDLEKYLPKTYRQQHLEMQELRKKLNEGDPNNYAERYTHLMRWAGYQPTPLPGRQPPAVVEAKFPFYPHRFFYKKPGLGKFVVQFHRNENAIQHVRQDLTETEETWEKADAACFQVWGLGKTIRHQASWVRSHGIVVTRSSPGDAVILQCLGIRLPPSFCDRSSVEGSTVSVAASSDFSQGHLKYVVASSITNSSGASPNEKRMQYQAGFEKNISLSGKELGWTPSNYQAMLGNLPAITLGTDPDRMEGGDILPGLHEALERCASRMEFMETLEAQQSVATSSGRSGSGKRKRSPSDPPDSLAASSALETSVFTQNTHPSV